MHALNAYWKREHGSYLNNSQLKQMSSLDDMFIACLDPGFVDCNVSSFHYIYHPKFYQCYSYNSTEVQLAGLSNSLVVDLFLGASDTQRDADRLLYTGVHVYVKHASEYLFHYDSSPFFLTPGSVYRFRMERTFYKQYNAWPFAYSECTVDENGELMQPLADSSLFDTVRATGHAYSQKVCIEACLQMLIVDTCGCHKFNSVFRFDSTANNNVSFCASNSTCMEEVSIKVRTSFDFMRDHCLQRCPLECVTYALDMSVVTSGFPPSSVFAKFKLKSNRVLAKRRAKDDDYVNASAYPGYNLARFTFYYETLSVTHIEEQPKMTLDTLIGTIGGHLHLFLGMSLISFVEIAVLGVHFAASSFRPSTLNCFKQKKNATQNLATKATNQSQVEQNVTSNRNHGLKHHR